MRATTRRRSGEAAAPAPTSRDTAVPNEACVLNDIQVQNYVLQLPITGGSVLPLSNYFIFSPS